MIQSPEKIQHIKMGFSRFMAVYMIEPTGLITFEAGKNEVSSFNNQPSFILEQEGLLLNRP